MEEAMQQVESLANRVCAVASTQLDPGMGAVNGEDRDPGDVEREMLDEVGVVDKRAAEEEAREQYEALKADEALAR